jgi:hypothetical protein
VKKNKRNTRRGRAKRWMYNGYGVWFARGLSLGVFVCGTRRWGWVLDDARHQIGFPSRAAAMRAAEHLARRQ